MKVTGVSILFCFVLAASLGAEASNDRTITKVVKLLESLLEKSKADGETDRDLYAKFKCYCDDNEDEKTLSIEELTKQIGILESHIEELRGSTGELSTECAQLRSDMEENEAARAEAEAIRKKAHADFVAEEADLTSAIDQMDLAIKTLSDIGADQTMSVGADHTQYMAGHEALLRLKSTVKQALVAASVFLPQKQRRSVDSFLQAPFTGTYTSQSGEIVGILKNMRDTFEANLAAARATEKAEEAAFQKFMKIKLEAYETMKASYEEKQEALGSNDDNLAAKKDQLVEAKEQKASDEEILAKLLLMCADKAKQYEERKMLRANEDAALAEAIAILNSDAAFESFGKVDATKTGAIGGATLLQLSSRAYASARRDALQFLKSAANAQKSLRLARIAAQLEAGNPFTVVLEEIKKMIELIGLEGKADKEQLDWCNSERETNHKDLKEKKDQIETLNGEITDLDTLINDPETGLKVQIQDTEAKLESNHESQVSETKARTEENLAYQQDVANIVEAEDLLSRAIRVLNKYYAGLEKRYAEEALLQREEPAPPSTWEGNYGGQSGKGKDAISMLKFILEESQKEERVAHSDEEESQTAYEDSMTTLKKEQAELEESLANLKATLAEKEKELQEKHEDLKQTEADKLAIEEYLEKIKPGCDFITTNFDLRETNRGKEKAALEKATELLQGTPAFKAAVVAAEEEAMGDCKETCVGREEHVECKACLAKVTVPGYCAGHEGTEGC